MTKISAIICTHNNCQLLKKGIESLLNQSLDSKECEILIIDNNSQDETKRMALVYADKFPCVKYFCERKLGLSHARNRAIHEANGAYLAFMDDDAEADREWLQKLVETFGHIKPKPDIIGGKVLINYEAQRIPSCINESVYYAKLDYGDKGFFIEGPPITRYLNGTNFAVCKKAAQEIGLFKSDLGRMGKSLISGEESDFLERAIKAGFKIYYEPAAQVTHLISKRKTGVIYMIRRSFAHGLTSILMMRARQILIKSKPVLIKNTIKEIFIDLKSMITKRDEFLKRVLQICEKLGKIYGVLYRGKQKI